MKYGFIGLGNMAGAILQGMHQSGRFGQDTLMGYDIDQGKMDALTSSVGLQAMASEAAVAQACDVLVLAVKPQMADGVLDKLKDALDEKKLVITVLAGKPLAYYASRLTPGVPVIRVLPNLNALAGRSTTGLCVNEHVSQQPFRHRMIQDIFPDQQTVQNKLPGAQLMNRHKQAGGIIKGGIESTRYHFRRFILPHPGRTVNHLAIKCIVHQTARL